ncbi:MarR family winged helix-turn-helix transcriptional regulator [Actinoplanes sp. CA-252034]|uniref:MarR family winged helix-turn-helix transcriptional regulator n=1 Tax=Actinoplanes sp. CA-252034 TaxID=3239906 RepID=UPI003D97F8F8
MRGSTDLMYLLTRAERLMSRRLAVILDAERCSPDAWRVVRVLADGRGHFMTELSELSLLPPGSLTRLIDRLAEEGLVYRRGDDVDRRRIRVHLSARGRRLHDRVEEESRRVLADLPVAPELLERLEVLITALDGSVATVSILQRGKALT